jgi:hypothetical protein
MSFKDLLAEVFWNWQPCGQPHHQVIVYENGDYVIDKLYIDKDKLEVSYKTELWKITQDTYDMFVDWHMFTEMLINNDEPTKKDILNDKEIPFDR